VALNLISIFGLSLWCQSYN